VSIAVIGSHGFIGRALVATLRAANMSVVEFPSAKPFLHSDGSPSDELAGAGAVCYLASRINPAIAERDPMAVEAHVATLQLLIRAMSGSGKRLIYPSSGGTVYDPAGDPPYSETSALGPIGRFGAAKVEVERLLSEAAGVETVAMRISTAYGPGQRTGTGLGVIAHWLEAAADGKALHLFGPPETTRDFIYVDDVCEAFLRVISSDHPPSVVNIGSGAPTSLAALAELIAEIADGVEIVHDPDRGFDVARSWLDISRAGQTLGWEPRVQLPEGIARTWEHYLGQRRADELVDSASGSVAPDDDR
jgi:UDP-glucose 4-epimerase